MLGFGKATKDKGSSTTNKVSKDKKSSAMASTEKEKKKRREQLADSVNLQEVDTSADARGFKVPFMIRFGLAKSMYSSWSLTRKKEKVRESMMKWDERFREQQMAGRSNEAECIFGDSFNRITYQQQMKKLKKQDAKLDKKLEFKKKMQAIIGTVTNNISTMGRTALQKNILDETVKGDVSGSSSKIVPGSEMSL